MAHPRAPNICCIMNPVVWVRDPAAFLAGVEALAVGDEMLVVVLAATLRTVESDEVLSELCNVGRLAVLDVVLGPAVVLVLGIVLSEMPDVVVVSEVLIVVDEDGGEVDEEIG